MIEQQRSNTLSEVGGWVIDYHWSSIDRSEQSKKEKNKQIVIFLPGINVFVLLTISTTNSYCSIYCEVNATSECLKQRTHGA